MSRELEQVQRPGKGSACCGRRGRNLGVAGLALLAFLTGGAGRAAGPLTKGLADLGTVDAGECQLLCDNLEMDGRSGWVKATGHVTVSRGEVSLEADSVRYNQKTRDTYAVGHVVLRKPGVVWRGEKMHYNFDARNAKFERAALDMPPLHIQAEETQQIDGNRYRLKKAVATTCEQPAGHSHYRISAREMEVTPGEFVKAKGVVWSFGPVPVFYVPYWYRSLDQSFGIQLRPGYNSRMGPFLLSSFSYPLTQAVSGETHVDYRGRRGAAAGQDIRWKLDQGAHAGSARVYGALDQHPLQGGEDPATHKVETERYRYVLTERLEMSPSDVLALKADYVSDTDLLEDFFEDEYRVEIQPDNYLTYTHRGQESAVAGVVFRGRINDFFPSVNREPEVFYDVMRSPLGVGSLYYEGRNRLGLFQRLSASGDPLEVDYSSLRFDTVHTLFKPVKLDGFINLIPRAGVRGTFYSETPDSYTNESDVVITGDGGSEFRSLFETGLSGSFKAFKVWDSSLGLRRHVLEPYFDYTLRPEPSVAPERLFHFDEVDRLNTANFLRLGTRNKYQKQGGGGLVQDLADVDVYTRLLFERPENHGLLDDIRVDAELRPVDAFTFDFDAAYDPDDSLFNEYSGRGRVRVSQVWGTRGEYRFRRGDLLNSNGDSDARGEDSRLLALGLTLAPSLTWLFDFSGRYELEQSRFEEQRGSIQRTLDCLVLRLGVGHLPAYTLSDNTRRAEEWQVLLEFWLTAFPSVRVGGSSY